MLMEDTLLDFSTAGPIADATPPMVVKVVMTKFLLLSYKRPLRAPNNSPDDQMQSAINIRKYHSDETYVLIKLMMKAIPVPVG